MSTPLFTTLSSKSIAACIARASKRVCYAAPGLHEAAAAPGCRGRRHQMAQNP